LALKPGFDCKPHFRVKTEVLTSLDLTFKNPKKP
jgi:hypothetical protein